MSRINLPKKLLFVIGIILPALIVVGVLSTSGLSVAGNSQSSWRLVFEDNFDSFDRSKWITMHDNGNRTIWITKELEWYDDNNVVAENGILKLIAKKESIYGKDVESEKEFDFTSGMICNSKSFTQTYGKWEMRVRFPFRKGYWPAFFIVPLTRPTLPEIDVFEYFGIEENQISCSHHWGIDYGLQAPDYNMKTKVLDGNFSDQWMIWAIEITPTNLVWKLNGNIVYKSKQGIPTTPVYMIANVAIKDWTSSGITSDDIKNNSTDPYVMEIDYVKIYEWVQ